MKQILGKLDKVLADKYNITEHADKKIVLYPNDKRHCEKRHLHDFSNKKHFYYVMYNLDIIISEPYYVYYYKNKKTLEYYKDIGQDIAIMVRIEEGVQLKVKTVFPVKKSRIQNRKKRELWDKYIKQLS